MIKNGKKNAFTLAELIVVLIIVGVIAAFAIPTLMQPVTNKNKVLYKKALTTIEQAVTSVMSDYEVVDTRKFFEQLSNFDDSINLRELLAAKLNLNGGVSSEATTSKDKPAFTTVDGMIWWNIPKKWEPADASATPTYIDIWVDVNGDKAPNLSSSTPNLDSDAIPDILRIRITNDGNVITDASWDVENKYITAQGISDDER